MSDRDPWEQSLHRFARVLVGEDTLARQIALDAIEAAIARPPAHSDGTAIGRFLFAEVRRRALERHPAAESGPDPEPGDLPAEAAAAAAAATPAQIEANLRRLPEPERSALALLLLDALDTESIARVLSLPEPDLAASLHAARRKLHAALAPVAADLGGAS